MISEDRPDGYRAVKPHVRPRSMFLRASWWCQIMVMDGRIGGADSGSTRMAANRSSHLRLEHQVIIEFLVRGEDDSQKAVILSETGLLLLLR